MNTRKMQFKTILLLVSFLLVGIFVLQGCKKKTEPAEQPETEKAVSATIQQTTCPVMGGAINKDMFTEYKGKKVYFCCAGCETQFEKDPEKYIAKLPQFQD